MGRGGRSEIAQGRINATFAQAAQKAHASRTTRGNNKPRNYCESPSPAGLNAGFLWAKLTPIYHFAGSPGSERGLASDQRGELIGGCFWQDLCSNSSISCGCKQLSGAFRLARACCQNRPSSESAKITEGMEEHPKRGTWSLILAPGTEGMSRQQLPPDGFSFFGA